MTMKRAGVVAVLVASIAFLFRDVIAKLVLDWWNDDNYSHGLLVVPLAGYVWWRSRARLASLPVKPSMIGLLLVVGSILTLVAGVIGAELFLTRVALLGTVAGTVLFLRGTQYLKALGFAFLLLALAIPIPAIIFNQITFPLQLLASRFGEFAISACQIPVLREGNVITLASTSLEVVDACSGIRSLMSLLTLALVWGYLTESALWLRWVLALSSVPIAIFANGIRVAGTGVAAHFVGAAAAEGFLHTFSGWMVFVVAGVLLLAVERLAKWLGPAAPAAAASADPRMGPTASISLQAQQGAGFITRALVVSACLLAGAGALGAATRTEAIPLHQRLVTLPQTIGAWEGTGDQTLDRNVLGQLRVDDYLNRGYRAPGRPGISLYVGYYESQRQGQTMHSPLNCMPGAGWEPVYRGRIAIPAVDNGTASQTAEINQLVVQKGLDRLLVLYWYQAHGRIIASEYWGKIYTVVDAIRLNRSDAALVRVIVPISPQDTTDGQAATATGLEFVSELLPVLTKHLGG
ncbi:MAG: VPLPA-CTERM-specific exosortase XrtD [Acidobacteria bacterium]|nr:VPLPA-CTERM-specific exosortase XrtD [Acidobacteriota bacterium]